jgi:hypothetical protein
MNPLTDLKKVEEQVLAHLREDIRCEPLGAVGDDRIGCLTPLEYLNRDNIVVWIKPQNSRFEVTDYGEALPDPPTGEAQRKALDDAVGLIAHGHGVRLEGGRLLTYCGLEELGEHVWSVATAAAQISQLDAGLRHPRRQKEQTFAAEVERTLNERQKPHERGHVIEGQSGHHHKATIFLPASETVLEPVGAQFGQAASVYTKFGDIRNVNGFKLYSCLDDRQPMDAHVPSLLLQVSDAVVHWTRKDEWLDRLS